MYLLPAPELNPAQAGRNFAPTPAYQFHSRSLLVFYYSDAEAASLIGWNFISHLDFFPSFFSIRTKEGLSLINTTFLKAAPIILLRTLPLFHVPPQPHYFLFPFCWKCWILPNRIVIYLIEFRDMTIFLSVNSRGYKTKIRH